MPSVVNMHTNSSAMGNVASAHRISRHVVVSEMSGFCICFIYLAFIQINPVIQFACFDLGEGSHHPYLIIASKGVLSKPTIASKKGHESDKKYLPVILIT